MFWSFSLYDPEFPIASPNHFHLIASAIKSTELRTWEDIGNHRDRDHPVTIDKLEKPARDRLATLKLDDTDEIWSIRFTGRCRLWGIRDGTLIKILWLDPNHEVCRSHKKHT